MKNIRHGLILAIMSMNMIAGDGKFNVSTQLESQSFRNLTINGAAALEQVKVSEFLSVSGSLAAEDCSFNNGKISGSVSLEDTTVAGSLSVSGSCNAESCTLSDVTVSGACNMEDCHVATLTVSGALNIEDSEIHGDIQVASNDVCVTSSELHKSIYIDDAHWSFWGLFSGKKDKKLRLYDSKVHGDIEFKGAPGTVILHGSCMIGKVINGLVIKK